MVTLTNIQLARIPLLSSLLYSPFALDNMHRHLRADDILYPIAAHATRDSGRMMLNMTLTHENVTSNSLIVPEPDQVHVGNKSELELHLIIWLCCI